MPSCRPSTGRRPIFERNAFSLNSMGSVERTEYIGARASGFGHLLPFGRIPFGKLSVLQNAAGGAEIAQNHQIGVIGEGLRKSGFEPGLQIGATAQLRGAQKVEGFRYGFRRGLDRRRGVGRDLFVV